jgi:Ni/Co efflux regulator RcnB
MNGRKITTCALALACFAMSGKVVAAQGWQNNEEWNRRHPRFTEQDRQVTRDWYMQHRNRLGHGWRQKDRLPPYMESRLRRGQRLDPRLRREMHWLPRELAMRYGPAPRGYRYAIIGGNIVLLDDWYQVHDVFRLDFTIR